MAKPGALINCRQANRKSCIIISGGMLAESEMDSIIFGLFTLVIPSAVERSRHESFEVAQRDPSLPLGMTEQIKASHDPKSESKNPVRGTRFLNATVRSDN